MTVLRGCGGGLGLAGKFQWSSMRGQTGVDQSLLRVQSAPLASRFFPSRMPVAVFFEKSVI